MAEEQQLLERARSGEMAAFQELVEIHKKKIYYLALDMTGTHQDAEDVSQEVFMKAFQAIRNFRGDAAIGSWLYRIAVNTSRDHLRKRSVRLLPMEDEEGTVIDFPDHSAGPQKSVENLELRDQIEKALHTLTPREKSVFVLRHYHDHMLSEIAEILEISEGTVKSLLFRALRRLRKSLHAFEPQGVDQ